MQTTAVRRSILGGKDYYIGNPPMKYDLEISVSCYMNLIIRNSHIDHVKISFAFYQVCCIFDHWADILQLPKYSCAIINLIEKNKRRFFWHKR